MEISLVPQFTFSFKETLIDEIALEGLEGVGFNLLWRRIEKRISSPVTEKMKERFWSFIVNYDAISLYKLHEPLCYVEIKDRFELIDEESGNLLNPPDHLDGPYEYFPVVHDYGSSVYYKSRKKIPNTSVKNTPYEKVLELYGDTLVMVASLEERLKALAPHMPTNFVNTLTVPHYCLLELIGRARENGQMTIGTTNLTKIVKDSKLLFYHRKLLHSLDLIRVQAVPQATAGKSVKGLLVRLKRFHQPLLLSMPKKGKVYELVQYLLKQPNYTGTCKDVIDLKMLTQASCKRLYKCETAFVFDKIPVPAKTSNYRLSGKSISLSPPSEDSSQSEDEATEKKPTQCQYQVKVSLVRQAYERILEAGLQGLTQVELSELIGAEYYAARTICRTFKAKNIVKEIFVDKGKQRIARFVASASAAAVDPDYEAEKKKLIAYLNEKRNINKKKLEQNDSESEVPKKKLKTSETSQCTQDVIPDSDSIAENVTEVKCFEGIENLGQSLFFGPGRPPTLRQIKFANGILHTIRKYIVIYGYMNLNNLAAKESNEPVMDIKALKIVIQKLVHEGQIKLLKLTIFQKSRILVCAPHVQPTDPIIAAKYREISLASLRNKRVVKKLPTPAHCIAAKPLKVNLFPRNLKLQKLHEFLIKFVYFNVAENYCPDGPGISSLADVIPEFTVELVIGSMSNVSLLALSTVNLPQTMMKLKLRNVPTDIFKAFFATPLLQAIWRQHLKALSTLGLIQLIKSPTRNDENLMLSYEFYVNRHASVIDTTGEWPRDNVDIEALRKSYYFETFDDVKRYWKDVYNICTATRLTVDPKLRYRNHVPFVARLKEELKDNDNGEFPGNGLGPGGYDASFYFEIQKFWTMTRQGLKRGSLKKAPIKVPRQKTSRKSKPKVNVAKKTVLLKSVDSKKSKGRERVPSSSLPKWSKQEDKIIMLCKAAMTIFSPTAQPGCLRLRNVVAKDILTLFDAKKTASACHKRAMILESNTALQYEKDYIVFGLRRFPRILRRYEGIYKTIKAQHYGNLNKAISVARLPFLELVWILQKLVHSESFHKKVPCVALNLEDFHNKYTVCPSTVNKHYNSYHTPRDASPVLAAVKEGIILALMHSYRSSLSNETARTIHGMLTVHSEQTLRAAMEQLRKAGALSAREKSFNKEIDWCRLQDVVRASYKISSSYQRHWICRMNSEFVDNLMFALEDDLKGSSVIPQKELKGNPEINCLMFESQASGVVEIVSESEPVVASSSGWQVQEEHLSVNDVTLNYNLRPGMVGWRPKKDIGKFSDLFQDIDHEGALQSMIRETQLGIPPNNIDKDDKIITHLQMKKRAGASLNELQSVTGYDKDNLTANLKSLESANIVKRVGYLENLLVLTKFAKAWTVKIKDKRVIPTPWITIRMDTRNDIFLKWAGTVVNKVFMKPGCSLAYIANECEHLTTRATQDICVILEQCKCVTLKTINVAEPDLFSDDDVPVCEEFNPYAPVENILVFPMKDILTKYAYIRKKMFDDQYYFENS